MTKVLFFTQNRWAFASLYHGLSKELYKYGIYTNLLDYNFSYSAEEFGLLIDTYDYFVTQPDSIPLLINYKVPTEKIVTVAHAEWDVNLANTNNVHDVTNNYSIHSYGVISDKLFDIVNSMGYNIKAKKVTNGINFEAFYAKPSTSLKHVGFGGAMKSYNFAGQEIKRGNLVHAAVSQTGLNFLPNGIYNYLSMPGYYKKVDAIVMASIEEACGLPMLEAAAAGKLCIGTPVGYFKENSKNGGGIAVDIEENKFLLQVADVLNYFKNNNQEYYKKCLDIQEYAR
jgi:glycosyltransferase involved in cell wall biosynthesis